MSKRKILIVMGGSYMGIGGIESMIMNYYREINKQNLKIDFVFFGNGQGLYDDELEENGSSQYHLPIKSRHYIKSKTEMKKLLLREKYDVVHANLNAAGILEALKEAKICGVPIRVAHAHSTNHGTTNKIKWYLNDWDRKRIKNYSTHNFACSDLAGKWYFGSERYEIVHNAICPEKFMFDSNKRERIRSDNEVTDKFIIGHVGNLGYPKNQEFLIEVYAQVYQENKQTELWLIGEGEHLEHLKCMSRELGIEENVKFLGRRNDVPELLQAIDVFALPSLFEGFPVSVVEAVAAGLPCVVSDRITRMVKLTDDVVMLNIDNNHKEWKDTILKYQNHKRANNLKVITEAGYNIKVEAKKMEKFYLTGSVDK